MQRHELLRHLHAALRPRTYLEIGVSSGASITHSRTRSIGVDPAFTIKRELHCDLRLVREESDVFFARQDPLAHFGGVPVDLAFVDGMHLAEYALRDVINVERFTHAASVVVVDDMLPRTVDEAARDRLNRTTRRGAWTGDVYKVAQVLRRHRPDLVVLDVDTQPTGVMVLLRLDAASRVLAEAYDEVLPGLLGSDPQEVPQSVLRRETAWDPEALISSPVWSALREAREADDASARVDAALAAAGWR